MFIVMVLKKLIENRSFCAWWYTDLGEETSLSLDNRCGQELGKELKNMQTEQSIYYCFSLPCD